VRSAYVRSPRPFLMVGYNRRFAPLVVRLRAALASVGRPLVLSYRVNAGSLSEGSWVLDAEEGGGRLIGEACHFVDLLMHLAGGPPRSVRVVRPTTHGQFGDRETFVALLEFGEGSIATLTYSAGGDPAHPKERLEVIGGGAVAILEDFRSLTITHRGRRKRWRTLGRDKGHQGALQATVEAIRAGRPAPISFQEIVVGTQATFALRASVAVGDAVALPAPVEGATASA
jgi:predicted dehydrogenase